MKRTSRIMSLLMCLVVAMTMCLGTIAPVFASDESGAPSGVAGDSIVEEAVFSADDVEASMADSQSVPIASGATITPNANIIYVMPTPTSGTGTFKIKAATNGYITLDLVGASDNSSGGLYTYGVNYKTSGFKDFEWVSTSNVERYIAVKKGTYTFTVKPIGDFCLIKAKFTKVKQGKFGAKKKKAYKIKRKKTIKGLMITNAKKTHWYKFKNPKTKKVQIIINGKESGGVVAGLKVSVYDKRGLIGSKNIYSPGGKLTIKPYTLGKGSKLIKGNYWIKIQSYNKGNGYFTVKWK